MAPLFRPITPETLPCTDTTFIVTRYFMVTLRRPWTRADSCMSSICIRRRCKPVRSTKRQNESKPEAPRFVFRGAFFLRAQDYSEEREVGGFVSDGTSGEGAIAFAGRQ